MKDAGLQELQLPVKITSPFRNRQQNPQKSWQLLNVFGMQSCTVSKKPLLIPSSAETSANAASGLEVRCAVPATLMLDVTVPEPGHLAGGHCRRESPALFKALLQAERF